MNSTNFNIRIPEGTIVNCYSYNKPVKIDEVYLEIDNNSEAGKELRAQLEPHSGDAVGNLIYSIEYRTGGIVSIKIDKTITIGIGVRTM